MPEQPSCPTRLLSDRPTDDDKFGSHKRIAEAIADLVVREEGGRAIALTGPWGSGKSSVVRLLQTAAEARKTPECDTEVVVFDAWAHQGDPLRRTFLECLMDRLAGAGWRPQECEAEWSSIKARMARRESDETIIRSPSLTGLGWIVAALYLLAPAAVGFVLKLWDPEVPAHYSWVPKLAFWVLLAPLAIVGGAAIWRKAIEKLPASGVLATLVNKSTEVTRSRSIRTIDPTSVEFQGYFHQILSGALAQDSRRLVLVVDNLDRMRREESLSIWATMKTFFESPHLDEARWRTRLWLIVPYDHSSLARLWEAGGDGEDSSDADLARSFIEKAFQVRFHVPRPVVSDWRSFLEGALEEALPKHVEDRHKVYLLYRAYQDLIRKHDHTPPPTPREMRMFVNDLGAVHRQWCKQDSSIPLADQALFVLMERNRDDILGRIRNPDGDPLMKDPRVRGLVSPDFLRNMAAMLFNVEPQKAYQELFGRDVEAYLTSGDGERLGALAQYDGVCEVIEEVVAGSAPDWATTGPVSLACAAAAMVQMPAELCTHGSYLEGRRLLCAAASGVPHWDLRDERVVGGLIALMQFDASTAFAKKLVAAACAAPPAEAEA